jgi:hypothetical protein
MWIGLNWLKAGPSHDSKFPFVGSQSFTPVENCIHFKVSLGRRVGLFRLVCLTKNL